MLWTLFLAVPTFLILAALIRTRVDNHRRYREICARREAGIGGPHLDDKTLRQNIYGTWLWCRPFGVTVAAGRYFGNCFWPAIVLTKDKHSHLVLTIRTGPGLETSVSFGRLTEPLFTRVGNKLIRNENRRTTLLPRLWWHSTHVARRFGHSIEAPHGTIWSYRGWLGTHIDC